MKMMTELKYLNSPPVSHIVAIMSLIDIYVYCNSRQRFSRRSGGERRKANARLAKKDKSVNNRSVG